MTKTILKKLSDAGVFYVSVSKEKTHVLFTECCDYYFSKELDKKEIQQLINELNTIANEMI